MDFELMLKVYPFFLEAAWLTILLSVLTAILGLTCGALGAAARLSRFRTLRFIGAAYVSVIRGTPALIQLFILYFGGPQIGIQLDAFEAGVIGLGVNAGAYMTETIRGAIIAIDKGQREAARTLGLSQWQAMYKVILPQSARLMIRPLGVNINALIKATALVAAISVVELTYTAQRYIGSTYKPFEMFLLAGILYMIIIYVAGRGIAWLDRKAQIT
ncbi:amino acid ABC transporter permease [Sulfitobacter mediterraneus]|uniref:amino acid ABC transporter permease n=1 Tax=Sulfitobacter mediterraneus TaxID=83219 RepID=UPI0019337B61|nr:amino acid ABC transporter permease [Sulfitobacter mediterraneus]MBM1311304.1 amino acid ABC transporter permease [Sulfitobacter mediterraneus]MBM1315186.1 amino acid ABC transporter permease [Sulfitobacter mediterraneus]MBM1323547.1 amino acid ABC transporter permease [Sulfitobacter mediterraneus]MBM1327459.1 amino acid ABC transporter permease [Sulfitobacter mediterraneus]MBM1398807.1 amino acid ABC transporter permease [Sulfitobacter mediterraneus]